MELWSEKTGRIHINEENMRVFIRPGFQAVLLNLRTGSDERIRFSQIPWPYTLLFVFGYSIKIFLTPDVKKEMHDRGSHLFYTVSRLYDIYFQKDQNYFIVSIHYSRDFVQLNLEDSAQVIRDRWELHAPVFYFSRPVISKRETMEQLSMLLVSGAEAWEEDFILHEVARMLLLNFLKEGEHLFQPAHLSAGDFETFYRERDALVSLSSEIAPVSKLLNLAGIGHVPLFRKKLHQLYDINIRDFITEIRMARAMSLLKDPGFSIKEIAYKTGFASAFYFSRVFSHYFGFPPKYFRQKKNI